MLLLWLWKSLLFTPAKYFTEKELENPGNIKQGEGLKMSNPSFDQSKRNKAE